MDQRVLKVIALMKKTLHKGWSAAGLAEFVNLSPSRLHQVFREETGMPPARYLRLLRMQRARELLETSHLSVKQVMARVGVMDESHFVRDFKKTYGFPPARYKQRFLSGAPTEGLPPKPARGSSVPTRPALQLFPRRPSAASALTGVTAPPLVLRRPSHPHRLTPNKSALIRVRKRAELLSLLLLRHAAFAELTTEIIDNIVSSSAGLRPISYRPRRSATWRRRPPSVERPQPAPTRAPRSSVTPPPPSSLAARRRA